LNLDLYNQLLLPLLTYLSFLFLFLLFLFLLFLFLLFLFLLFLFLLLLFSATVLSYCVCYIVVLLYVGYVLLKRTPTSCDRTDY
jgi:hypothetical protein